MFLVAIRPEMPAAAARNVLAIADDLPALAGTQRSAHAAMYSAVSVQPRQFTNCL
jgi:hypothetical protein